MLYNFKTVCTTRWSNTYHFTIMCLLSAKLTQSIKATRTTKRRREKISKDPTNIVYQKYTDSASRGLSRSTGSQHIENKSSFNEKAKNILSTFQ